MKNKQIASLIQNISEFASKLARYKVILVVVLVALVYGFIFMRIAQLGAAEPSETMILEQSNTITTTRVDDNVVRQLEQLQDNSVNVQALFQEARNNPFQE